MTAVFLNPDTFALVTDPISAEPTIVLVDKTGFGYFDLGNTRQLPKPLLPELQPRDVGSIRNWVINAETDKKRVLLDAWSQMTDLGIDAITIARSLYWARFNEVDDFDVIRKYGEGETARIAATAKMLEGVIKVS